MEQLGSGKLVEWCQGNLTLVAGTVTATVPKSIPSKAIVIPSLLPGLVFKMLISWNRLSIVLECNMRIIVMLTL